MMINQEPTDGGASGDRVWKRSSRPAPSAWCSSRAIRDLEFRWVAKAIDIAHGAGIDKVGLMTAKVEAGK